MVCASLINSLLDGLMVVSEVSEIVLCATSVTVSDVTTNVVAVSARLAVVVASRLTTLLVVKVTESVTVEADVVCMESITVESENLLEVSAMLLVTAWTVVVTPVEEIVSMTLSVAVVTVTEDDVSRTVVAFSVG